ncbi:hypothetical protein FRC10_006513, partial [Ceratobasidium sp. 414]
PPASEEAAMMDYATPSREYPSPQAVEVPLPHTEDMDLVVDLMLPESTRPPSREATPVSRSVSQIPELPVTVKDVPDALPFQPGRENVHANVILSCIVKAGGRAQRALQDGSTVETALEILYRAVDDGTQGIKALADTVIASGDKEMYKKTTAVRASYRSIIYQILRDLDDMTCRESNANLPTEGIPTDMFAILRSLKDMSDENEINAAELRAEMAELKMSFAALRADAPNASVPPPRPAATPTAGPKDTTGPKSTPGPKSTVGTKSTTGPKSTPPKATIPPRVPAPPPFKGPNTKAPAQTPAAAPAPTPKTKAKTKTVTIQVSGSGPSSLPAPNLDLDASPVVVDWNDMMDADDGPMKGVNTGPADTDLLKDPPLLDGEKEADVDPNDSFQTVDKGKGKAHGAQPKRSFAQAAKAVVPPMPPKTPIPNATKIANDIRSEGRTSTPLRYAATVNLDETYKRKTSRTMWALVNDTLIRKGAHVRIMHIDWNEKGRIVLNFPAGASVNEVVDALPDISKVLGFPEDTHYERCTTWSKVAVTRARTGFESGEGTRYSEQEILDLLTTSNRHIARLNITYGPRWVTRDPDPKKTLSTFTFAFEDDANGSILNGIIGLPIYFGGARL